MLCCVAWAVFAVDAGSASEEWVALEDDEDGVNAGRSLVPRVEVLQRLRQKHATTVVVGY